MTFKGKVVEVIYQGDLTTKCLVEDLETGDVMVVSFRTSDFVLAVGEECEFEVYFKVIVREREQGKHYNQMINCKSVLREKQ